MSRRLPDSLVSRRALRWAVLAGVVAASFTAASLAFAGFNSPASGGPGTYASKRIFPGIRSTSAWTLRDASGGAAETNSDDTLSYTDALLKTTGNWATTFSATRYVEFDFNSPTAGGVTVSSAQFTYRMAANSAGDTACFYFEVYRASTSTLIGTHGSTGTPVACNATTTQTTYSTTLAEVTDTTILNDLRVRVYGKESGQQADEAGSGDRHGLDAVRELHAIREDLPRPVDRDRGDDELEPRDLRRQHHLRQRRQLGDDVRRGAVHEVHLRSRTFRAAR